jgi:hypothetical protein
MISEIRYARRWYEWKLGETRIIRTLNCWQVQSQVGKVRKKRPECAGWRWSTRKLDDGSVEVRRVM